MSLQVSHYYQWRNYNVGGNEKLVECVASDVGVESRQEYCTTTIITSSTDRLSTVVASYGFCAKTAAFSHIPSLALSHGNAMEIFLLLVLLETALKDKKI